MHAQLRAHFESGHVGLYGLNVRILQIRLSPRGRVSLSSVVGPTPQLGVLDVLSSELMGRILPVMNECCTLPDFFV